MTGISTVSKRRLPASLSSSPIRTAKHQALVVARYRANGRDHFLVGHLFAAAGEAGVAAIGEDEAIVLGIASQGRDQLPSFGVIERTEVHRRSPSRKTRAPFLSPVGLPARPTEDKPPDPRGSRAD